MEISDFFFCVSVDLIFKKSDFSDKSEISDKGYGNWGIDEKTRLFKLLPMKGKNCKTEANKLGKSSVGFLTPLEHASIFRANCSILKR